MKSHNAYFGKDKRLLNSKEFKRVFDTPIKKIHSKNLLLFVSQNEKNHARLGLAITKKKLKNATDRNRLKRLTREVFRHHQSQIAPLDVVLIVKTTFDKKIDILGELQDIFDKLTQVLG